MSLILNKCETCLSTDRLLVCTTKIQSIINEIQLEKILNTSGGVCWECHRRMVDFYTFRSQAKKAQDILSTNIEQNQNTLSKLSKLTKINFDYEYTHHYDPLVQTVEDKAESKMIKREASISSDDEPLNVFAECIEIKNGGRKISSEKSLNKKIKQCTKSKVYLEDFKKEKDSKENFTKTEDVKDKFETILFTEEEMLKCREEKRNQANFKKIPFKCDLCVIGFIKKENYEIHLRKKHDKSIGAHICSVCQTIFPNETSLTRHHKKHYLQYRCKLCDYKVSSYKAATNHARYKHTDDTVNRICCKQCSYVGKTSKDLAEHSRSEHSFICNECGVKFKGKNTLRAHKIRIHAVKREFACDTCSKTFVSLSRLESHVARHSATVARHLAYCATCRTQYKNVHVYRAHLRNSARHVQDRIACPVCGKRFASRVYYNKHYNFYHLRQSRFKCLACDKIFISEWRLKIHRQTHHGLTRSRDHACTVCGKKFYSKSTLATHSLVHCARRFMCATCGVTFTQRAALYTHNKLMHANK